jgi:hypothetical protein
MGLMDTGNLTYRASQQSTQGPTLGNRTFPREAATCWKACERSYFIAWLRSPSMQQFRVKYSRFFGKADGFGFNTAQDTFS